MRSVKVWDPFVRVYHWGTALLFLANMFVLEEDGRAHAVAGYILFGLVLARLAWGLVGTKHARFSAFRPRAADVVAHLKGLVTGRRAVHLSHNPLGAVMVYNLLATLLAISVTGLMLESDVFWGIAWVEELHEILADYATVCVGLHIAGVLLETRLSRINLVKAMLTGRKDIPDQVT